VGDGADIRGVLTLAGFQTRTRVLAVMIIAAGAVAAVAAEVIPAAAQTGRHYARDTAVVANGAHVPLVSVTINANQGDKFYVNARMHTQSARQNRTHRMLAALLLGCTDGVRELLTTKNFNYGQQRLTHVGRYIFQAPRDGTFTCRLRARGMVHGAQSNPPARYVVDGAGTYLAVSGVQPAWVTHRYQSNQRLIPSRVSRDVMVTTFTTPTGVSRFSVTADLEMTDCYNDGQACDTAPMNSGSSNVGSQLIVMQKNRSGGYCRTTKWPASGLKRTTITFQEHHEKAYHRIENVPVSTNASCTRSFRIKVYTRVVSGNDLMIEAKPYTNLFVKP
jgi:hypothetical protein